METYKNDYNKNKDFCLWELHEIRNKIHKKIEKKSANKLNEEAKLKFKNWIKNNKKQLISY